MIDPAAARRAFRLPDDVVYLDTASNAPRLHAVDAALQDAWALNATPWRYDWATWQASIERVRTLASQLFFRDLTADADGVALMPSVAAAMSTVAANWPLQRGEHVLMREGEFPSALLPWQARCAHAGAAIDTIGGADATARMIDAVERGNASLLVLSESHWRDGARIDIDAIAAAAQRAGVPLVLDLSQSHGALPCDIARWQPAFAMSVGYKWWLAGKGLCALWVAPAWRERVQPVEQHWQQRVPCAPWRFDSDAPPPFAVGARRLDGGEVCEPLRLATTEAALAQVLDWTPQAIAARLDALLSRLRARLHEAGLESWCAPDPSPHLMGLAPHADRLHAVREAFARAQVIAIERDGVFRLAPHLHVDEAQIDRLAGIVIDAARA